MGTLLRVEYRKLALLKKHFPETPIIALTATATLEVEKDILQQLSMQNPVTIKEVLIGLIKDRVNQKNQVNKQLLDFI